MDRYMLPDKSPVGIGPSCGQRKIDSHEARHSPRLSRNHRCHDRRTEYSTRSCFGKPGDTLRLDVDTKSHPAWTGVQRMLDTGGQVAKFNKRFAGIGTRTKG
jgi:large subunit ribosomal protein L31